MMYMMTEATKKKISDSKKANPTRYWLGKKFSKEHKDALSSSHKGQKSWNKTKTGVYSQESLDKMSRARAGKAPANKGKNSPIKGEKHWNWQGGLTPINESVRKSIEYKTWRTSVFERDNYTCVECGHVGGDLHADHIKQFAFYVELRFELDNGRTLCVPCHRLTETYGRQKNIQEIEGDYNANTI